MTHDVHPRSVALLTMVAMIVAYVERESAALLLPLTTATLTSIGHFVVTSQAAPTMLRVSKTPDDKALLLPMLDRFARWSAVRATLRILTMFILLWALVVA